MPGLLEESAQSELARDAAEQLAGREADPSGGRRRDPAGIALARRDLVARVGRRVAVDGIVVEHTEHSCHGVRSFFARTAGSSWRASPHPGVPSSASPPVGVCPVWPPAQSCAWQAGAATL